MSTRKSRLLAAPLAVCISVFPALRAAPGAPGTLSGEVLGADVAGAVVHAAIDAKTVRSSAPIGADGKFAIDGLQEGVWSVAVQTRAGLLVSPSPVAVRAGQNRAVRISLAPAVQADDEPVVATPDKGGMRFWNNPLTATLIVVGAAIVVGVAVDGLTNNNEPTPVSPSTN